MAEAPNLALAFAAGTVSFLSPCCLPLVPGYLAAIGGGAPEPGSRGSWHTLSQGMVFVATFSAVFIAFGLTATALGNALFDNQPLLNKVSGGLIIAMGVLFIASVFVASLNRDFHPDALVQRAGSGGPVVAGAAFAIAWTPCVGPTLGAILSLAATSQGTREGALLLAIYSMGLGLPFLVSAVAYDRVASSFAFFRRHAMVLQVGAGTVLVAMGLLVVTGELFRLNVQAQQLLDGYGLNFFQSV